MGYFIWLNCWNEIFLKITFLSLKFVWSKIYKSGVSVKFLLVRETNSMVGYHLMTEGHSIQLGSGGRYEPPAGPGQRPDNNNININNNIFRVSYKITIKSQFLNQSASSL